MQRTNRLFADALLSAVFLIAGILAAEALAPGRDVAAAWTVPAILVAALQPALWSRVSCPRPARAAAVALASLVALMIYGALVFFDLATLFAPDPRVPWYLGWAGNLLAPLAAAVESLRLLHRFARAALGVDLSGEAVSPRAMLQSWKGRTARRTWFG
ncbi:hypothetical protein SAMN06265365_12653 [Tistlia consotensis]|uniref:Uncharacterized protein n=1 Tax=Tistlia consotensis USBA 355 TaxID=560819 RepID=A0A1Y6CN36_9PROT|nr:hypothetical protein [Tistlia consotensis]SMF65670.1 hypothetical protein SAMN05428998_12637 [Tistlia consotensis USBA 355]SNS03350.1 hypothetical protein SAMN06265365_12653 [Tistlia consotensis]